MIACSGMLEAMKCRFLLPPPKSLVDKSPIISILNRQQCQQSVMPSQKMDTLSDSECHSTQSNEHIAKNEEIDIL